MAISQLYNPKLSVRNIYLRNCKILSSQSCIAITESFPNITIQLAYMPGKCNQADSLTKFCQDPIKIINSLRYLQGPAFLTEENFEDKISTFYEVKGKNFKYTTLLDEKQNLLTMQKELEE